MAVEGPVRRGRVREAVREVREARREVEEEAGRRRRTLGGGPGVEVGEVVRWERRVRAREVRPEPEGPARVAEWAVEMRVRREVRGRERGRGRRGLVVVGVWGGWGQGGRVVGVEVEVEGGEGGGGGGEGGEELLLGGQAEIEDVEGEEGDERDGDQRHVVAFAVDPGGGQRGVGGFEASRGGGGGGGEEGEGSGGGGRGGLVGGREDARDVAGARGWGDAEVAEEEEDCARSMGVRGGWAVPLEEDSWTGMGAGMNVGEGRGLKDVVVAGFCCSCSAGRAAWGAEETEMAEEEGSAGEVSVDSSSPALTMIAKLHCAPRRCCLHRPRCAHPIASTR